MEPLLSFPRPLSPRMMQFLPDLKEDGISYCSLCDFKVKRHSKHCRTCNRWLCLIIIAGLHAFEKAIYVFVDIDLLVVSFVSAMGQLFFFHVVLMFTVDPFDDLDVSLIDSSDFDSPEKPSSISRNVVDSRTTALLISKAKLPGSPVRFSSRPRRRFSDSLTMFSSVLTSPKKKYRSSFDLKLTDVSRELETYISFQGKFYVLL
ncbi:hypothetical protein GQ457_06G030760 [Hibiscus cannabinus]